MLKSLFLGSFLCDLLLFCFLVSSLDLWGGRWDDRSLLEKDSLTDILSFVQTSPLEERPSSPLPWDAAFLSKAKNVEEVLSFINDLPEGLRPEPFGYWKGHPIFQQGNCYQDFEKTWEGSSENQIWEDMFSIFFPEEKWNEFYDLSSVHHQISQIKNPGPAVQTLRSLINQTIPKSSSESEDSDDDLENPLIQQALLTFAHQGQARTQTIHESESNFQSAMEKLKGRHPHPKCISEAGLRTICSGLNFSKTETGMIVKQLARLNSMENQAFQG